MKKLDGRVERKKEMYRLYKDLLKDIDGLEFIDTNLEDTPLWFIDILVNRDKRDILISFLKEKGIGTRPFYPAIHTQLPYNHLKGDFKNSENASARGLWLPSSSLLSNEKIEYICQAIKCFFKK
jgi:perosamine synthetase